jgi:hypothetical protein
MRKIVVCAEFSELARVSVAHRDIEFPRIAHVTAFQPTSILKVLSLPNRHWLLTPNTVV